MGDTWKNEYRSYQLTAGLKWNFFKTAYFRLRSTNNFYSGSFYRDGDYNNTLLDLLIGAKFFKNDCLGVELMFVDALHDRNSIRNTTATDYMSFSRSSVLENYVLLKLTYNFNTLGSQSAFPEPAMMIME